MTHKLLYDDIFLSDVANLAVTISKLRQKKPHPYSIDQLRERRRLLEERSRLYARLQGILDTHPLARHAILDAN